jgi:hypothetical protein
MTYPMLHTHYQNYMQETKRLLRAFSLVGVFDYIALLETLVKHNRTSLHESQIPFFAEDLFTAEELLQLLSICCINSIGLFEYDEGLYVSTFLRRIPAGYQPEEPQKWSDTRRRMVNKCIYESNKEILAITKGSLNVIG